MKTSISLVYLDMDGVVADFDKHLASLSLPTFLGENEVWEAIFRQDEFFYNIPPMQHGIVLWSRLHHAVPTHMLTALPYTNSDAIRDQKERWCARYLSPLTPVHTVIGAKKKALFACPGRLLIDDRADTCLAFEQMGGHAICHSSVEDTLLQLSRDYTFTFGEIDPHLPKY